MGQERLNHLMTLNVHNHSIDSVDLVEVANQFVSGDEYRQHIYVWQVLINYSTFRVLLGFAQLYKYSGYQYARHETQQQPGVIAVTIKKATWVL